MSPIESLSAIGQPYQSSLSALPAAQPCSDPAQDPNGCCTPGPATDTTCLSEEAMSGDLCRSAMQAGTLPNG